VEVTKVPTPATPADSLGGSVNMISKSAFERTRAQFNFSLSQVANSENLTYRKTPHSFDDKMTRKIRPGWDFDFTLPLGKNFGITLTGFQSDKFNEQHLTTTLYNAAGTSTGASITNPFLQQHLLQDAPRSQMRTTFSLKADWRITPNGVLSLGAQSSRSSNHGVSMNWTTDVGTTGTPTIAGGVPLTFGEKFTQGATGRGTVTLAGGGHPFTSETSLLNLNYRFDDGRWKVEAGMSQSDSSRTRTNTGQFSGLNSALTNPARVVFSEINPERPGTIRVFDNSNREIDIYDIRNYRATTATLGPYNNTSVSRSANLNVKRRFNFFPFPFALQAGGVRTDFRADTRTESYTLNYNGPDGDPATPDSPEPFLMQNYRNMDSFYGFKNVPWTSAKGAYVAYLANPRLFSSTPAQVVAAENARRSASEYVQEVVSALYLQAEARLMNNRLNVLTGVRFEKTTDQGEGSLFDANAVFVRNTDGTFARTATGARIRKPAAGAVGSMEELLLTRQERAFKNKRSYDGYFPSLHLTYNITATVQARLAYAKTYGRPGYSDIIPNATFSERDLSEADFNNPDVIKGTVTIRNTALRPWTADNYDLSVEYYSQSGGVVSGGLFLKEIKDFFGTRVIVAKLDDLEAVGLDPRYVNWNLSTKFNSGNARITGAEFNVRQSLRNLGAWGNPFTVFANGTKLKLAGESQADFTSFIPESANWGVSFSRKRITLIAKWNYRGRERRGTRPAFGPDGFEYFAPRTQLDLNGAYRINKNFSLNVSASNALNVPAIRQQYGSQTPGYARQNRSEEFGVALALGLKGSF
jgi:TonB-dependent receptor